MAAVVDREAADHVVCAGADGDFVARDVDAELKARGGDAGEAFFYEVAVEVSDVEIDAGVPRFFHLRDDGLRDDVARGELGSGVVFGHEAEAVFINEPAAFAADGFGDEAAAAAGDVQNRRMELGEFHVAELGTGTVTEGVAVAGGDGGVGRFAIDLAAAAGGEDGLAGPDEHFFAVAIGDDRAAASTVAR